MLDVLRRHAGSWAIKIILGFIAVTFIVWGVGDYGERQRGVAATIGETKISTSDLAEAVSGLEKAYRDVYGPAFTPEMAKALDLKKQALDGLIQKAILLSEARKLGIDATDDEVQRDIAATPAFQVDGRFSADRYQNTLKYNRTTAAAFEESKRQEITLRKMEGLLAAGANVPETEARELFRLASRKVRLLVATADPDKMKGVAPPGEAEIAAKYEQTKESHRIPARAKLLVAKFDPAFFARDASVTDNEIRAFYEGNSDRFRDEERRLVSQIFLPYGKNDRDAAAAKAAGLAAEAAKGKQEFERLAKKHSKAKSGESWMKRGDARPEVEGPLFSAGVDQVVGPIDVGNGFLLVRVNRIRFPETLPLSEVKDRVVSLLRREKGKDASIIKAYEAHAKASTAKDVKGVAAAYGIPVEETGWTGDPRGEKLPQAVVQEALLLPVGEVGPVKAAGDVQYLFKVAAKEDSRIPPLSEIRDKVAAAALRDRRRAFAEAELQKALSSAKTPAALAEAAKKAGLATATTPPFSPLTDPLPENLPPTPETRKAIMSLTAKAPVLGKAVEAQGRFAALALVEERNPDDKEWAARKESFMRSAAEQKKTQLISAFLSERRAKEKVEINPDALK